MKLTDRTFITSACLALLILTFKPSVVTSLVTSYEKLRDLVTNGDSPLVQAIEEGVKFHLDKAKNLTRLLAGHSRSDVKAHQMKAAHPNDFYLLVKHHFDAWASDSDGITNEQVLEELVRSQKVIFPTLSDVEGAVESLVRLQFVYGLKADDMVRGNYSGYMGSPLEMGDPLVLGTNAISNGYLSQGVEWLHLSQNMLHRELQNESLPPQDQDYFHTLYRLTLSVLGKAYFYMNDTETAQKMYDLSKAAGAAEEDGNLKELGDFLQAEDKESIRKDYVLNSLDTDANYSLLCSRDKDHRLDALRPYHICRYKSDAFIPYYRFREEILSTSPYASLFYDVIHESEMEQLKQLAKGNLQRGLTYNEHGEQATSDTRTGDVSWVSDSDDAVAARVSQRVKAFTRLDTNSTTVDGEVYYAESFQMVNYGVGGHYDVHIDALRRYPSGQNDRIVTVLFYLTDVEKGGATVFPRIGVSVSPKKGMALLWYSYEPHHAAMDENSLHAGCPVIIGNKWIVNKWLWAYGNTFRRLCGPSPTSQQLDVEQTVSTDVLRAT